MFMLSNRHQWWVGSVLLLTLVLTRSHIINHVQDASWAVLFLAGFYLRPMWSLLPFLLAAWLTDYTVIHAGDVSGYCFTPAYGGVLIAYGALWLAGRWFAGQYRWNWHGLVDFAIAAGSGVVAGFLVSNLTFYAFSGYFKDMTGLEYAHSVARYLPVYLQTTLVQVAIAALLHVAVLQVRQYQPRIPS